MHQKIQSFKCHDFSTTLAKMTMNGSRSLHNSSDILLREKKSFYTVVVTRTTEEVFEN